MITIEVIGTEVLAARFRTEIRSFQREFRKQMVLAATLVKKDVIAKVGAIFPTSTGAHKRSGATPLGPLRKKIGVRIINTRGDVIALIRPKASAFYGRFQETGLDVTRKGRATSTTRSFFGKVRHTRAGGHPFHLPRKPFLEPVAEADTEKVVEILGNSYSVFYRGGE